MTRFTTNRWMLAVALAAVAVFIATTAITSAIVNRRPDPAASAPPAAAPPPTSPGPPPSSPGEPASRVPGVGIPVVVADGVPVDDALAAQVGAAASYTSAAYSRDCARVPYPGIRVQEMAALATGRLSEDLRYQQRDWARPRTQDLQTCRQEALEQYQVIATPTRAAVPLSGDGKRRVIITFTHREGPQVPVERHVGYVVESVSGTWKISELIDNPPLHF